MRALAALIVLLLLAACSSHQPLLRGVDVGASAAVELAEVPFFPQADYQCGPAALATVLNHSGLAIQPDELVSQVYVPARKGSLQPEILAATRRAGRIPYVIESDLKVLVAALEAGQPVLVLQNLGMKLWPVWHYAVVIGVDPEAERVILRSGRERRVVLSTRRFLRTWNDSKNWAMVVLQPGELPDYARQTGYLSAVANAEGALLAKARHLAYGVALMRWPENLTAQFGLAHAHYERGNLEAAEHGYRAVLDVDGRNAAALNNLAQILTERGCPLQARPLVVRALEIARVDQPAFVDSIRDTLKKIATSALDGPGCHAIPARGSGAPSNETAP